MDEQLELKIRDTIRKGEDSLVQIRAEILRATRGGVPTGELEKRRAALEDRLRLLRAAYGE